MTQATFLLKLLVYNLILLYVLKFELCFASALVCSEIRDMFSLPLDTGAENLH
jgi:hypothetical protein